MATKIFESKMFGGLWQRYRHQSDAVGTPMEFSVYLPPRAVFHGERVKVLYYLSGLTCTDKNVMEKSGIQRPAAESNVAIIAPDTSPRNPPEAKIPGEDDSWDFGSGAGFYVDATQEPWCRQYRMYTYVTVELPSVAAAALPGHLLTGPGTASIMGHSMGGHGALVIALRNPGRFASVSAVAPICHPTDCPWGQKNLGGYLGADRGAWRAYDATELVATYAGPPLRLLVSQGGKDEFLERELKPDALQAAVAGHPLLSVDYRLDEGYDHSYCYIATVIGDHVKHHADALHSAALQ
jgi:S-formylglutathione hydrolase